MGSLKDQWMDEQFDRQQERKFRKIADYLGLTYEEVEEASPEIEPNQTSDDAVVGWDIMFPQDTPKHILDKLGGETMHRVDVNFFDDGDDYAEGDYVEDDYVDEGGSGFVDMPAEQAMRIAEELRKKEGPSGK